MSVYSIRSLRQQATAENDHVQEERDGQTSSASPTAANAAAADLNADATAPAPSPPSPASALTTALLGLARSDVTIISYFFLVLLLYFRGSANPVQWLDRLHILVVDLDAPLTSTSTPAIPTMGQTLRRVIAGQTGDHLSFFLYSATDYGSAAAAADAAYAAPSGSEYWASILARDNATIQWQADLQSALAGGAVTLAANNVLFIVATARNSFLYGNYIVSQINPLLGEATGMFEIEAGQQLLTSIAACSNVTGCIAGFLAQPLFVQSYLLNPMLSSEVDVAPAQPFIGTVTTTLGLVIQWIFSAAVVGTTIGNSARLVSTLSVWRVVLLRIANTFLKTLVLSGLFVGMVAWWAEGAFSGSTIGMYWMFAWLYMSTFCMFNIIFALNLGVLADLTGVLFLFLIVVSSTSQLPVQLQQRFYTIGVGLPLYNAIVGSRRILMDGKQEDVGTHVAVLLAWLIGCSAFNFAVDSRRMHILKQAQERAAGTPPLNPSP